MSARIPSAVFLIERHGRILGSPGRPLPYPGPATRPATRKLPAPSKNSNALVSSKRKAPTPPQHAPAIQQQEPKTCMFAFSSRDHVDIVSATMLKYGMSSEVEDLGTSTYCLRHTTTDAPSSSMAPGGGSGKPALIKPLRRNDISVNIMATSHADLMARVNGTVLCLVDNVSTYRNATVIRGALLNGNSACDVELTRIHLMNLVNDASTDYAMLGSGSLQDLVQYIDFGADGDDEDEDYDGSRYM